MPPGPTAAHIVATLREYGGEVDHMDQAEKLAALLGDPLAPASLWVIADAAYARELRSWAVQPAQARCGARVVVVMQSEERRQYRDLLGPPLAGYVLKPFRRGSLLRLITMVDPISGAVAELRQIAGRAAKQQGPRVLLAEDNPVNALLARTLLERAGCVVAHVLNGRQALEALAGAPRPDLIIMDVEMPGMDGLEATRRIRAREAESGAGRIPILALTANSRAEDHAQCLAAGMDGHLSKPFDRQDLDEAIGRLVPLRPAA
jgi:CheY-like chemotaxis protein